MAQNKSHRAQLLFSRGEITPLLSGRTDVEPVMAGCSRLQNMFLEVTGGVSRRPGLQYIADAKGFAAEIESFAAQPNQDVYALDQQSDGKILIAGVFTSVGGAARTGLARLELDGSVDTSFNPVLDVSTVFQVEVLSDDKIAIAGNFTTVNGDSQAKIALLNSDGTRDTDFSPTISDVPNRIAEESDGSLLIAHHDSGGPFSSINGSGWTSSIARLSRTGVHDTTFGNGINFSDNNGIGISVVGTNIYVHRLYSSFNTWYGRRGIVKIDSVSGSVESGFDAGMLGYFGSINVLQVQDAGSGNIWINGSFIEINGSTAHMVAKIDAETGDLAAGSPSIDFSTGLNGSTGVNRLGVRSDGFLVMLGFFSNVNGTPLEQVACVSATDGSLHPLWNNLNPGPMSEVGSDTGDLIILSPSDYAMIGTQDSMTIGGNPRDALALIDRSGNIVSL